MQETNSNPMETVRSVLEAVHGSILPLEGKSGYRLDFEPEENVPAIGVAMIFEEVSRCAFFLELQKPVPEAARLAVSEYITRANFGLLIGHFEMDLESGTLRCKTDVDFQGGHLLQEAVSTAIVNCLDLLERYYDGIQDVISGLKTAKDAIKDAELH